MLSITPNVKICTNNNEASDNIQYIPWMVHVYVHKNMEIWALVSYYRRVQLSTIQQLPFNGPLQ